MFLRERIFIFTIFLNILINILVANSLWNNMLERVGNKTIGVTRNLFERFLCPSEENPYIFTNRNSR